MICFLFWIKYLNKQDFKSAVTLGPESWYTYIDLQPYLKKTGILGNFAKFTGRFLCQTLFCRKLQECRKIWTRKKTQYLDTFHAVIFFSKYAQQFQECFWAFWYCPFFMFEAIWCSLAIFHELLFRKYDSER